MIIIFYESAPEFSLYTKISFQLFKKFFYTILAQLVPKRGPSSVAQNLLKELVIRTDLYWTLGYKGIPNNCSIHSIWVVNDTRDLRWAINNKTKIGAKSLLAGPNIVVVPKESCGILGNEKIDKIIVPSLWVKEFYQSDMPIIGEKINIWPVGIDISYWQKSTACNNDLSNKIIIYNKNLDVLCSVIQKKIPNNWDIEVINYGKYNQKTYKKALENARFMIWLSQSESQGIALLEALSMNVPVLAWDPHQCHYRSKELNQMYSITSNSCPYFSSECGMIFSNIEIFNSYLNEFIEKNEKRTFKPRDYLINNKLFIGETLRMYNILE